MTPCTAGDLDVAAVYGTPFDHVTRADHTLAWSEARNKLYPPGPISSQVQSRDSIL